jgi:spore germination cell wall hydrolase CwlJ-like protein
MAERKEVGDPLAPNPLGNPSVRQLGQMGINNPRQSGGTDWIDGQMEIQNAIGRLSQAVGKAADAKNDDDITEGRLQYLRGVKQDEIYRTGNKYNQQGWQSLNSASQANDFVLTEQQRLQDGDYRLDPDEYNAQLMQRRSDRLSELPDDPAVRKLFVQQFDATSGPLIEAQVEAHNKWNKDRTGTEFHNLLFSTPKTDPNAHRVMPGSDLRVSPGIVSKPIKVSAYDRDVGIRTLLGEAGMEGDNGMAAVAHTLKNRAHSSYRGKNSIAGVALDEAQFSTWNKGPGGNGPERYSATSNAYKRAGQVFDSVMAGRVQDMTGGHLNYFSPLGMDKLVAEGSQSNRTPQGYKGVGLKLGGHVFWGDKVASANTTMTGVSSGAIGGEDVIVPPGSNPEDVRAELGIGAGPEAPPMSASLDILLNSTVLPDEDKAVIAANGMIDDLSRGDDTSFTELGGIGTLQQLGLDPQNIQKVEEAYNKFKSKSADEFNIAHETKLDGIMQRVKRGEITPQEAGEELKPMIDGATMTNDQARSLQHAYFNAAREGDDKFIENPDLQVALANIQIALGQDDALTGGTTLPDAIAAAQALGKQYGIPADKMATTVGQLVEIAKSKKQKAQADMLKNAEIYRKNQSQSRAANTAIANGYGIAELSGTIAVDVGGVQTDIPLKQYAIDQIKQSVINEAKRKVGRGGGTDEMSMADASVWADREIHRRLKKQAVVDEQQKTMVTAALGGAVVGAGGKITEDAKIAAEWFVTMAKDSSVGLEYASQYLGNGDARALALEVNANMQGGLSLEDQIFSANARLTKEYKADDNEKFITRKRVEEKVAETVATITDTSSVQWQGWIANTTGIGKLDAVNPDLISANSAAIAQRLETHARTMKRNHPQISEQAAIDGAMADTSNEGILLGGQIYFGDTKRGTRLDQVMQTPGDKMGPQKALSHYVEKYYSGMLGTSEDGRAVLAAHDESWWETTKRVTGGVYDVATAALNAPVVGGYDQAMGQTMKGMDALSGAPQLPYYVTMDERTYTAQISFYDPETKMTLITKKVDLREVGKVWKSDTQNDVSLFGRITNSVLRTLTTDETE